MNIALPPGIGDSLWSLTKLPGLLRAEGVTETDVTVCGGPPDRAQEFLARFDFVHNVYTDREHLIPNGTDSEGRHCYTPSGRKFHHVYDWQVQCNHDLERGVRLERILPEFGTAWDIARHFQYDENDWRAANQMAEEAQKPYVVFVGGPEEGNTTQGHNRGGMWRAIDWVKLEQGFYDRGYAVVITGAMYDRSYVERHLRGAGFRGLERVGVWPIHSTFAVIKKAKAIISYQCGLGIFAVFMGVPTCMWWAPKGHSQCSDRYVCFEEAMAHCWAPPESLSSGLYLPQIYTRSTPEGILDHADRYWLK